MTGPKRRASAGNTHDPWPCCQAEAGAYGRPKGTICRDCRSLIDEGKAARQALAPDLKPFVWTKARHGWPQFYGSGASLPSEIHQALGNAFFDVVARVTLAAPADTSWRDGDEPNAPDRPKLLTHRPSSSDSWLFGWRCLVLANPGTVAALDALHRAILKALWASYSAGKERGGSALFALASGELSLADFDHTLNPGKDQD